MSSISFAAKYLRGPRGSVFAGLRRRRVPPADLKAGRACIRGVELLEPRLLLSGGGLTGATLWADADLTQPGLVGSYVDADLSSLAGTSDWRFTQPISGARLDDPPEFLADDWGSRAELGLTHGSDADWDQFSVQWDGFLEVIWASQRFATVSDDCSRMWIDTDNDGTFEDAELLDNGWGGWQGSTTGERSAGVPAGVYPIRIQYCEGFGANTFSLVTSPYVPPQLVPTPTNPRQVVRVVVLNFDPRVPSEQNKLLHEVFGWSDPHQMAVEFERDLEWATGGAIDIQIVEWRDLDAFPTFTDGFRYNPDEYVANRRAGSGWHDAGTDFYELIDSQDLLPLINAGLVDEIWTFGDHYFNLLGEAWMAGPNSFFINGPSFLDAGFDRAVAGYGFSYERGVAEMIHNLGHRTENHGQRAFGSWNLWQPATAWDRFSANYLDTATGPYGVGTCHVPANADDHYDYGDTRIVDSIAANFVNYPDLSGPAEPVGRDTWAMGPSPDYQRDYLTWYFASMPRNDSTDADGRMANWYKYIWDFNSYEAGTGLARGEDAFGAGPVVRRAGAASYELTVRYYDETGVDVALLDDGDVRVVAPDGTELAAALSDPGVETATTAGTARTVRYTVVPPGGAWDVLDNGTYRIVMRSDEVRDLEGNPVPAGEIGFFRVAIPDPAAIQVAAMLSAGEATASHSPFDIGSAESLFDGNTSSLARTAGVNPAQVTLSFDAAQTVTGFRTFFSHAGGDPAYSYTIESADSLADLDARSGSYRLLVPQTGTPSDAFSSVALAAPHAARVFRLTCTRNTGDDYVHINEWQLLGTATAESDAPAAALEPVAEPTRGQTAQFLTVTFDDATAIDVPSLGNGDLHVIGPGGQTITPTFYDVDDHTDGPTRTATYWFIPPGGSWDYEDNGTYTVELQPGSVHDILWNEVGGATLGTFDVDIPPPQFRPPADLAESNAADWTAWAAEATASVSDDTSRTVAGASAIRFETTGGFDTFVRYGGEGAADWDLSGATRLEFSVYAENPSPYDFQEGPWVRLYGADGAYFEYRYYENDHPATPLNGAVDRWATFVIPLAGATEPSGWRRTTSGSPDMAHIVSAEFHADTWDFGFVLWLDGVSFDVPASVMARQTFYNNSAFDSYTPGADQADDDARALDKQPLWAGAPEPLARPENITGYSRGLNGVMIDVAGLTSTELAATSSPSSSDFEFRVGNSLDPATWRSSFDAFEPAPLPAGVTVRDVGDGVSRVTLIWEEGAIRNEWLQVRMIATEATGLAEDEVFYFGNLMGETGGDPLQAVADAGDLDRTRDAVDLGRLVGVQDPYDFDRNGIVNFADLILVRNAATAGRQLAMLDLGALGSRAPLTSGRATAAALESDVPSGGPILAADAYDVTLAEAGGGSRSLWRAASRWLWYYEFQQLQTARDAKAAARHAAAVDLLLRTWDGAE